MASDVTYVGFRINKNGVNPLPEKVADLLNAETPKNTTQFKSFLGMLNYYHRHLPNLADILEPLHKLYFYVKTVNGTGEGSKSRVLKK